MASVSSNILDYWEDNKDVLNPTDVVQLYLQERKKKLLIEKNKYKTTKIPKSKKIHNYNNTGSANIRKHKDVDSYEYEYVSFDKSSIYEEEFSQSDTCDDTTLNSKRQVRSTINGDSAHVLSQEKERNLSKQSCQRVDAHNPAASTSVTGGSATTKNSRMRSSKPAIPSSSSSIKPSSRTKSNIPAVNGHNHNAIAMQEDVSIVTDLTENSYIEKHMLDGGDSSFSTHTHNKSVDFDSMETSLDKADNASIGTMSKQSQRTNGTSRLKLLKSHVHTPSTKPVIIKELKSNNNRPTLPEVGNSIGIPSSLPEIDINSSQFDWTSVKNLPKEKNKSSSVTKLPLLSADKNFSKSDGSALSDNSPTKSLFNKKPRAFPGPKGRLNSSSAPSSNHVTTTAPVGNRSSIKISHRSSNSSLTNQTRYDQSSADDVRKGDNSARSFLDLEDSYNPDGSRVISAKDLQAASSSSTSNELGFSLLDLEFSNSSLPTDAATAAATTTTATATESDPTVTDPVNDATTEGLGIAESDIIKTSEVMKPESTSSDFLPPYSDDTADVLTSTIHTLALPSVLSDSTTGGSNERGTGIKPVQSSSPPPPAVAVASSHTHSLKTTVVSSSINSKSTDETTIMRKATWIGSIIGNKGSTEGSTSAGTSASASTSVDLLPMPSSGGATPGAAKSKMKPIMDLATAFADALRNKKQTLKQTNTRASLEYLLPNSPTTQQLPKFPGFQQTPKVNAEDSRDLYMKRQLKWDAFCSKMTKMGLVITSDRVEKSDRLGRGKFASVYLGVLKTDRSALLSTPTIAAGVVASGGSGTNDYYSTIVTRSFSRPPSRPPSRGGSTVRPQSALAVSSVTNSLKRLNMSVPPSQMVSPHDSPRGTELAPNTVPQTPTIVMKTTVAMKIANFSGNDVVFESHHLTTKTAMNVSNTVANTAAALSQNSRSKFIKSLFSNLPGTYSVFDDIPYEYENQDYDDDEEVTRGGGGDDRDMSLHIDTFYEELDDEKSYHSDIVMTREIIPPPQVLDEYEREIDALHSLSGHKNMIQLYGIILKPLAIVMQRMDYSLADYMASDSWKDVTSTQKLNMMCAIAAGVSHMHKRLFIHRDLKPHNCLIRIDKPNAKLKILNSPKAAATVAATNAVAAIMAAGTGAAMTLSENQLSNEDTTTKIVVKIADLGTAIKVSSMQSRELTEACGTSGYTAPEVLRIDSRGGSYGLPADVYSFGFLCWELFSTTPQANPLKGLDATKAVQNIEEGIRPSFDHVEHSAAIQNIITMSWCTEPEARPTMNDIEALIARSQLLD